MDIVIEALKNGYKQLVERKYSAQVHSWPVLSGYDLAWGVWGSFFVIVFRHTGRPSMVATEVINSSKMAQLTGGIPVSDANKELVRTSIRQRMILLPNDLVFLLKNNKPLPGELDGKTFEISIEGAVIHAELTNALLQHEFALGLAPMKIFLSHRGVDKTIVREYRQILQLLGFEPWLDEDAMPAGTSLERGILQGFNDSCAAVFFVTPSFADESYLATEVDYAIQQKRAKVDRFSIITLVLSEGAVKGNVPPLLRPYVWKEPANHLQGLREILLALPIKVSEVRWRR